MRQRDSVVGAAILRGGRCLVARRGPGMDLAGRWEFPGGKPEAGESPEAAQEAIRAELSQRVSDAFALALPQLPAAASDLESLEALAARFEA